MTIGPTPLNLGNAANVSATSLSFTTLNNITAGDLVVVCSYSNLTNAPIATITDGANDANYVSAIVGTQSNGPAMDIWYVPTAIAVAAGATFTVNYSGATARHGVSAFTIPFTGPSTDVVPATVFATSVGPAAAITASLANRASVTWQPTWANSVLHRSGLVSFKDSAQTTTDLVVGLWISATTPTTYVPSAGFAAIGGSLATAIVRPAWMIASPPAVAVASGGVSKAKNKGKRVWRVMLPDGKIVICDSPTEYYNLLTRAVNEPEPSVAGPVSTVAETLEIAAEPERPKQPLLKLRPAEKREALNWAAAENMAVNLRALADSIRAARTPIADNDDDEAAELLRWVI